MRFSRQFKRYAFLFFALLPCLYAGCGKSGVRGKVSVSDAPVAAGTITFTLENEPNQKLVGTISNGTYSIESKIMPGDYNVQIDIHFVNADEAEAFYANMSKELNKTKILHGDTPELVTDPDQENADNEDDDEKPKIESPLKSHSFRSSLTGGSNVHDFNIDP